MDIKESYDITEDVRRHFWEIARLEFIKKLIFRTVNSPKTVIDIGCGDSFVLKSLAELFPETGFAGIDSALTDEMIKTLTVQANFPSNIILDRKLDLCQENKADLILLLDVLEHIEDDKKFLCDLHDLLHQNSRIIITVPAFQSLFTDHDRYLKHYRRYNRKELQQLLENTGFKIIHSGYIFCSLLPFRILQKLSGAKSAEKDNLRAGNKFINTLIAGILKTDAAVSFWLSCKKIYIPGLSCFAVTELKSEK